MLLSFDDDWMDAMTGDGGIIGDDDADDDGDVVKNFIWTIRFDDDDS